MATISYQLDHAEAAGGTSGDEGAHGQLVKTEVMTV